MSLVLTTPEIADSPGYWEVAQRGPAPPWRGIIHDLTGYVEQADTAVRRHELPSAQIIVVINLGDPLLVQQPGSGARLIANGAGFVAGLHDTYSITETSGFQAGIELRLSPLGAYRLFGQPMDALANRTVTLDELGPAWASLPLDHARELATWEARFALLEQALQARLGHGRLPSPELIWAWRQLHASAGRAPIAALGQELGWSARRLIARFRDEIGVSPKQAARLIRFQRAVESPGFQAQADWSQFAQEHGYYDQSHLSNEFQRFAGDTPQRLARRWMHESAGYTATLT